MHTQTKNQIKMKVKIESSEKAVKEIDIDFPYYTKSSNSIYKFLNERNCIEVYIGFDNFSIDHTPYKTFALAFEPSTSDEFYEKLNIIKSKINDI